MMRWLCVALLVGCWGTTPEEAAEEALGDTDQNVPQPDGRNGPGPYHRPGQPCLVCHSDAHNPGGQVFLLAGTVYDHIDSTDGLAGVEVHMEDAEERQFVALTNEVGTFYVRRNSGLDAPRQIPEYELQIPFTPRFPISVFIEQGTERLEMRSMIQREGSCAGCHERGGEAAESPGQVYLRQGPQP